MANNTATVAMDNDHAQIEREHNQSEMVDNQISEQQQAILDTEGNTESEKENTDTDNSGETQEDEVSETETVEALEGEQPQSEEETVEHSESFDAIASGYESDELELEDLENALADGEITRDEFIKITGLVPDEIEPEPTPKVEETKVSEDSVIREELSHWQPEAKNPEEAREAVRNAIAAKLAHDAEGETNLLSKMAFAFADWLFWNGGFVREGSNEYPDQVGNNVVHVTPGLYKDVLKHAVKDIYKEELSTSQRTSLQPAIQASILLMAKKLHKGYFVLPPDRFRPGMATASPEMPTDIPEGYKVLRGLCLPYNEMVPMLATITKDANGKDIKVWDTPNPSTELKLIGGAEMVNTLYTSLWDREGEIRYNHDPVGGNGLIKTFVSGSELAKERKKEQNAAKRLADAQALVDLKEGRITAEQYKEKTGKDAHGATEPDTRAANGVPTNAETPEAHDTTLTRILNKNDPTAEEMGILREGVSKMRQELADLRREKAQLEAAKSEDIGSVFPALPALIRDKGLAESQRIAFWRSMHELVRRVYPNIKKMSREELRACVIAKRDLDAIIEDGEEGTILKDLDGNPLMSYTDL